MREWTAFCSMIVMAVSSYASKHMVKRSNSQHACYQQISTVKIFPIWFAGFRIPAYGIVQSIANYPALPDIQYIPKI